MCECVYIYIYIYFYIFISIYAILVIENKSHANHHSLVLPNSVNLEFQELCFPNRWYNWNEPFFVNLATVNFRIKFQGIGSLCVIQNFKVWTPLKILNPKLLSVCYLVHLLMSQTIKCTIWVNFVSAETPPPPSTKSHTCPSPEPVYFPAGTGKKRSTPNFLVVILSREPWGFIVIIILLGSPPLLFPLRELSFMPEDWWWGFHAALTLTFDQGWPPLVNDGLNGASSELCPGRTVCHGPLQNEPFLQHCDMQTLAIQEGSRVMMQSYPFFFLFFCFNSKLFCFGNSLMVQWLGFCSFTAGSQGSIPGQGTKSPQAVCCSQNKQIKGFVLF